MKLFDFACRVVTRPSWLWLDRQVYLGGNHSGRHSKEQKIASYSIQKLRCLIKPQKIPDNCKVTLSRAVNEQATHS